jgi:hypothetical protein
MKSFPHLSAPALDIKIILLCFFFLTNSKASLAVSHGYILNFAN